MNDKHYYIIIRVIIICHLNNGVTNKCVIRSLFMSIIYIIVLLWNIDPVDQSIIIKYHCKPITLVRVIIPRSFFPFISVIV